MNIKKITKKFIHNKRATVVFILCWIAYASIYFGRVNLSVAAVDIQNSLQVNKTQVGFLGTLFFWIYGTGQLINGNLGDRFSSYKMIFLGLFVTGIANILFGFATSLVIMLIAWGFNGYFQSMLWGPIIRTLTKWFPKSSKSKISVGISTSMVAGYLLAWGLSGELTATFGWNWAFLVPGVFIFIYSIVWFFNLRKLDRKRNKNKKKVTDNSEKENKNSAKQISMRTLIFEKKLWLTACVCMTQGFIKESVSLWGPIFIMEKNNIDLSVLPGIIIIIPVVNFAGLLLAGRISKLFNNNEKLTIVTMYVICASMLITLLAIKNIPLIIFVLITGGISGAMFGANSMLLGVIPMKYANYRRSSSAAGFLDFCSYIAAGISATVVGAVSNAAGWTAVISLWIVIAVIGVIFTLIGNYYDKKYNMA